MSKAHGALRMIEVWCSDANGSVEDFASADPESLFMDLGELRAQHIPVDPRRRP